MLETKIFSPVRLAWAKAVATWRAPAGRKNTRQERKRQEKKCRRAATERMSHGDGATIGVDFVERDLQMLDREHSLESREHFAERDF